MKMILQENLRYADLITKALDFSEVLLTYTNSLYPFAVISIENDVQSVFLEEECETVPSSMIEKLETQIALRTCQAETAIGILVYSVTVITPEGNHSDGLMLSISDSSGASTMTIYPYEYDYNGITIGKPYTCDFSN
jgi:hypothetical protein